MKHFARIAFASLMLGALALGGCAQLQTFAGNVGSAYTAVTTATVDYRQALAAVQGFESLQRAGQVYLSLPTCSRTQGAPCHDRASTKTINALLRAGRVARGQVLDFMSANPCSGTSCPLLPSGLFASLSGVIGDINQVYATYKVAKGG